MNILFFLTHKANCTYIYDDFTLRQTLEKYCQFMPVPIYASEVKVLKHFLE